MKLPSLPIFNGDQPKGDDGVYKRWLAKLEKHAELLHWSARDKLLQFEWPRVLPPEGTFELGSQALGKRVQPAKREALSSAQLLRWRQKPGEVVDDFVREFERLFEDSYGHWHSKLR